MLYQFGVPLACGGLVLYDCRTQVSIASPQVRAGVSKKKRHCVYSAVMVVGSTGLVRSGATEYSRGVFAWRSGKRRRKGIAISNRHCVCSWRRRQVGWLIRLLHASVNRVTAGESWRKQKKETLCLQCRNGGGEYRARKERSDGILARCFAWRSGKRRRKGVAISNRHCVCSWRRRQVGWLIRLLHDSVNRVTAGESRRRQKKRHCVYSAVMVVGSTGLEPVTPCL